LTSLTIPGLILPRDPHIHEQFHNICTEAAERNPFTSRMTCSSMCSRRRSLSCEMTEISSLKCVEQASERRSTGPAYSLAMCLLLFCESPELPFPRDPRFGHSEGGALTENGRSLRPVKQAVCCETLTGKLTRFVVGGPEGPEEPDLRSLSGVFVQLSRRDWRTFPHGGHSTEDGQFLRKHITSYGADAMPHGGSVTRAG
jgi:hypothetical protein